MHSVRTFWEHGHPRTNTLKHQSSEDKSWGLCVIHRLMDDEDRVLGGWRSCPSSVSTDVRDVAGDHTLKQGRGRRPPPPRLVPLLCHPWSFQMRRLLHERASEMSWTGINVQRSVLWEHHLQPHPLLYRCSGGAALSTDSSWGIPFLRTVVIG